MQSTSLSLADRISLISVSSTARVSAEAERLRREGKDVIDFGVGEPDFPTPSNIKDAAISAIHGNFTRYTAMGGTLELRQAICARHKADYGTSYTAPECVVSVGGKHAIFNMCQVLVQPGDEVIIPVPYWVTYKDVVNYAGGHCVFVETDEAAGFELTAAMVEKHLTPKTRMIIVNSPSNPSGGVVTQSEFEKIAHLARERGVYVMTDECYHRFVYGEAPYSAAAFPGMKETVIVAGSLSKTYAMTGWRIGFTLAPATICSAILKLQSHSTSNPTSIAQKAALEAVTGPQESVDEMLAEYRKRRDYVVGRLRSMPGITANLPKGAFYAYPNIGATLGRQLKSTMDFAEKLLEEQHVAVVPGEAFGTSAHVRITYASSMDELKKGLDRIEAFVKQHA